MTTPADIHSRAAEIFLSLRELPKHEHAAALKLAVPDDETLRREVQSLLDHDIQDYPQSDETSPFPAASAVVPNFQMPQQIGPYTIISRIGSGGSGVVYLAEQTEPIHRKVAVKIVPHAAINPEMASRFEVEQRALERTDHPNIARILDAGRTEDGLPYLVMDFVDGLPLTEFCNRHVPSPFDRIKLFLLVADAVQHAHQRGVIHRDLKPANILVTQEPSRPAVPRVLDFGIAKPVAGSLTTHAPATIGLPLGTPAYMAPEQTGGQAVDTRADVYSLGVILYELLSGVPPIQTDGNILDALRRIRDEVPPPLSYSVSRNPKSNVSSRLSRSMLADLDCILDMALRKSPAQRYQTVAALIDDVNRLLRREPIVAHPPTLRYRAARFAQRNRALVASVAIIGLALLGGITGLTIGLVLAQMQQREAARQIDEKTRMNAFLTDDLLAAVAPDQAGSNVTAMDLLDRASRKVDVRFADNPLIAATIHHTLGVAYTQLGAYEKARNHIDVALQLRRQYSGPNSTETIHSEIADVELTAQLQKFDRAETALTSILARARVFLNKDDPVLYTAMADLAVIRLSLERTDSVVPLLQEALAGQVRLLQARDPSVLATLRYLSMAYGKLGDIDKALQTEIDELKIAQALDDPPRMQILALNNDIGATYQDMKKSDLAAPYLRDAYAQAVELLGEDNPGTLVIRGNLASLESDVGNPLRAVELFDKIIAEDQKTIGPNAQDTLTARHNRCNALWKAKKYAQAETDLRVLLDDVRQSLGEKHWFVAQVNSTLARVLADDNRYADARPFAQAAVDLFNELPDFGPRNNRTTTAVDMLRTIEERIADESSHQSDSSAYPVTTQPELAESAPR
ncbi:MAG TPA: serine/threonine-protein kinase [Phycisphaerales bacterium]|nr:serine/threonine-protein kinase [Phycisphaerales bacterium]